MNTADRPVTTRPQPAAAAPIGWSPRSGYPDRCCDAPGAACVALLVVRLLFAMTACVRASPAVDPTTGGSDGSSDEAFPGVTSAATPTRSPRSGSTTPFSVDKTDTTVIDKGDGEKVREGDRRCCSTSASTAAPVRSSTARGARGEPGDLPAGAGGLIPGSSTGWSGRSTAAAWRIAIPPDDGYGPAGGQPEAGIEADDTLVFVVDLLKAAEPPLSMAEGEEKSTRPRTCRSWRPTRDGIPTGFTATPRHDQAVEGRWWSHR